MSETPAIAVTKNADKHRYEISLDGERVGLADYYERGETVVLPHTETTPAFRGRGLAGQLIGFALDDIRAAGKTVSPVCPFVADYIRLNPQYRDLVA
jgi:predicted GNAT family acetyltransferase